jgi:hypothetical protein
MLMPRLLPDTMQHEGSVAMYFEAAAVIVVLVLLGQLVKLRACIALRLDACRRHPAVCRWSEVWTPDAAFG